MRESLVRMLSWSFQINGIGRVANRTSVIILKAIENQKGDNFWALRGDIQLFMRPKLRNTSML